MLHDILYGCILYDEHVKCITPLPSVSFTLLLHKQKGYHIHMQEFVVQEKSLNEKCHAGHKAYKAKFRGSSP